jgi:hypothetical protein
MPGEKKVYLQGWPLAAVAWFMIKDQKQIYFVKVMLYMQPLTLSR